MLNAEASNANTIRTRHHAPGQKVLFSAATPILNHCSQQPHRLRDGRQLRLQAKPRQMMAIDRFLARGAGFNTKTNEQTLEELGLSEMVPAHHGRSPV